MKNRIELAIKNMKSIPELAVYWANTLRQRCESTGAGSVYPSMSPETIEAAILSATWKEYSHPDVAPGCTALVSHDMPQGHLGIVELSRLDPNLFVVLDDRKGTGTVSATIPGVLGPLQDHTVLILGNENDMEVVFTFHPGAPTRPSSVKTEPGLHNKAVTVAQAIEMGLTRAKIVREALCNCTPHPIVVEIDGKRTTFPPSGIVPRLSVTEIEAADVAGFPAVTTEYGEIEGLPASQPGLTYIVSSMVLAQTDRHDCVAPDTGKTAIRKDGRIDAVIRFIRK